MPGLFLFIFCKGNIRFYVTLFASFIAFFTSLLICLQYKQAVNYFCVSGNHRRCSPFSKCKTLSRRLGPLLIIQFMPDGSRSHVILFPVCIVKITGGSLRLKFVEVKVSRRKKMKKGVRERARPSLLLPHPCSDFPLMDFCLFLLFLLCRGRTEPRMQALQSVVRLAGEASMPPD